MNKFEREKQIERMNRKIDAIVSGFPMFASMYFEEKKGKMSEKTLIGYAYDINKFLNWFKNDSYSKLKSIKDLTCVEFDNVSAHDLERYIVFLQKDASAANAAVSIRRKMSSLSSLYNFLWNRGFVSDNPCQQVEYPDIAAPDNNVLTDTQIQTLLYSISNVETYCSEKQMQYIKKTKLRDFAMVSLLLSTGIRVNELVALDVSSISFKKKIMYVDRGIFIQLPMSDNILDVMKKYMDYRKNIKTDSRALFLSMQNTRICIQAVEDSVKKYSAFLELPFVITPRTLRHTFAAVLFKTSADSDLLNSYMGIKPVNNIKILMNSLSDKDKLEVYTVLNELYDYNFLDFMK